MLISIVYWPSGNLFVRLVICHPNYQWCILITTRSHAFSPIHLWASIVSAVAPLSVDCQIVCANIVSHFPIPMLGWVHCWFHSINIIATGRNHPLTDLARNPHKGLGNVTIMGTCTISMLKFSWWIKFREYVCLILRPVADKFYFHECRLTCEIHET